MNQDRSEDQAKHVLVSDFDGTMTCRDFFKLAIQQLLPSDGPDFWSEYRAGRITHFEALRRYFAEILRHGGPGACRRRSDGTRSGPAAGRGPTAAGRLEGDRDFGRLRLVYPPPVGPGGRGVGGPFQSGPLRARLGVANGNARRFALSLADARRGQGPDRAASSWNKAARWPLPATGSPTRKRPCWFPALCASPAATWPTCSSRKANRSSRLTDGRRLRNVCSIQHKRTDMLRPTQIDIPTLCALSKALRPAGHLSRSCGHRQVVVLVSQGLPEPLPDRLSQGLNEHGIEAAAITR